MQFAPVESDGSLDQLRVSREQDRARGGTGGAEVGHAGDPIVSRLKLAKGRM